MYIIREWGMGNGIANTRSINEVLNPETFEGKGWVRNTFLVSKRLVTF
jgi:hypothetical protein